MTTFRSLHAGPSVFTLTNCWDAGSARILERCGAVAVATTSAGVAWSNGYGDGNRQPFAALLASVAAMKRVLTVPLTVDVEEGGANSPAEVAENMRRLMQLGTAGINLEDGRGSPEVLAEKIRHVRRAAAAEGVDFFINARTDVYLKQLAPEAQRLEEVLTRAQRYREAGADGLFVPRAAISEVERITGSVGLPVNLLAGSEVPSLEELTRLGVRRLSSGSAFPEMVGGRLTAIAKHFLETGSLGARDGSLTYAQLNDLFS